MNILYLLQRYPGYGGIEAVTTILTEELCKMYGHKIIVFSTSRQHVPSQVLNLNGWQLITTDLKNKELEDYFLDIVVNNSIDIIVYQDSYVPEDYLLENLDRSKVKLIVCEHNTPNCMEVGLLEITKSLPLSNIFNLYRRLRLPFRYKKVHEVAKSHHQKLVNIADKYVLLSDTFKPILKKEYGIEDNKIISIPETILPRGIEIKSKEKTVLFVGRLTDQKGIVYLMEIWRKIEEKFPDWSLKIVGDGDKREYIENYISKYSLTKVKLEGFQTNLSQYYSTASVFFMTSIYEGFGIVLAEAMSFGVIPFAFKSYASVTDIIEDKKNGFLIDPFNTESYVDTFTVFVGSSQYVQDIIRENALVKSEQFSVHGIAKIWNNLFNELQKK